MKKIKYIFLALMVSVCPFVFYACDLSEHYDFVSFNDFKTEYYVGEQFVLNSSLVIKNSSGEIITLEPGDYTVEGEMSTQEVGEHEIVIKYNEFSYTLKYTVLDNEQDVTSQEIINYLSNKLAKFYLNNNNITFSITPNITAKYLTETENITNGVDGSINFDQLCEQLFNKQGSFIKNVVNQVTNLFNNVGNLDNSYLTLKKYVYLTLSNPTSTDELTILSEYLSVLNLQSEFSFAQYIDGKFNTTFATSITQNGYAPYVTSLVEGAINAQNISNSQLNTDLKNIAKTLTLEIDKMLFGQNVDMGESIVSFFNGYIDLMNKYPELNNSDIRLILEQAIIVAESDGFDVALLNEILTQDDIKNAIVSIVKSGFNCSDRTAEKLTADLISFVTCEQTYNILLKDFLVEIGYKNDIISSISNVFLNAINCPPIEQYINIVNQNFSSDLYSMFIVNDNNFSMQNFSIEKIIKNAYKTLDALHYGYNQNLKNIVLILADESLTATFEERISLILSDDSFKNLTFELLEQIYQREITEAEQTEILSLIQDVVNYTNGQETLENVKTAFVDYLKVYFPSLPAEQVEELINQAIEHVLNVYNAISSQNWVELETRVNDVFTWLESRDVVVPQEVKSIANYVITQLKSGTIENFVFDVLEQIYQREIPTTERTEISSIIQGIVSYANGQTSLLEVATTVKDYLKVYFPSLQIEQVEDLITQGIEHVSEIYEAVCSKVFENIKSSLQSTIEWLEDLGVKISDTITNLLRTKELLVKELALLSNASTEAQLQEVEQKLNNIIEQVSNKQFAQALSSVESLLDSYYSEKSQTIFKSILTIYIVATNSLEDLDLNELFSFIELPEGVSIDYNKLYNKIKSTLTNSNIISIESAKTERVVVDDNNSYTKLVLIVNINVDVEIASISGSVKVEIN